MSSDSVTLIVYRNGETIFTSDGRWLHPLFDLEKHLTISDFDPSQLLLKDTIVGRAAAFLIARMGVRKIEAGILSKLAIGVLNQYEVQFEYGELVERILCQTEDLLAQVTDEDEAYKLLKERAQKAGK